MSDFMKIRPVGTELFHADGRTDRLTDMTNLVLRVHNLPKEPKMTLFDLDF